MHTSPLTPVRVNPVRIHPEERRFSLSGEWGFRLDPGDLGVAERWFDSPDAFRERIQVPGSWQAQGFGGDGKNTVMDFRFQTRTFRATYKGTGWYGRSFVPPDEWQDTRLVLCFGGAYPTAEAWLNGHRLGENHLPFVPFGFDVTEHLRFGEDNYVAVRVSEEDAELGFLYNMFGPWGGLYRDVELVATGASHFERLWLYPEVERERLRLRLRLGGECENRLALRIQVVPDASNERDGSVAPIRAEWDLGSPEAEFSVDVPTPALWSPDAPNLYRVDAVLLSEGEVMDAMSERVGFVRLATEGQQFLINGEPYFMRAHGDFDFPPETGCPDTDRDRWRKKLSALREWGYNQVRCQSFVPTPEYLDVADEVGLLVQSEMGMLGAWGGHSIYHGYNWPEPIPTYREQLKEQWDRVVQRDVNHPCANIYCMSNERGTGTTWARTAWQCYNDTKAVKPTALVLWTDGGHSPDMPQDFIDYNWPSSQPPPQDKPIREHEFRWWSSFPDVTQMHRFSGGLRPFAAEMATEAALKSGIAHTLPDAARNSQRLQFIEAKGKMEACRRDRPFLAGISHFSAVDAVPSPQGIIDAFYEQKHADAETWRRTNGDAVVLCSLNFDDRVLTSGGTFHCALYVSDFSRPAFRTSVIEWEFACCEGPRVSGQCEYAHAPRTTCEAGRIQCDIPRVDRPTKATLRAAIRDGDRQAVNEWDLWVFPDCGGPPSGAAVYGQPEYTWLARLAGVARLGSGDAGLATCATTVLSERLDSHLVAFMRSGGRVLLAATEGLLFPFAPKLGLTVGRYFFTPPAQYPPLENGHNGTIIADHPMLGDFPHERFADLHFYRMMGESPAMELAPLGLNEADPIIRVMHSYPIGRSLGYLTECAVGTGGMVLCSLDLDQSWPEARYLLHQLCRYLNSECFTPAQRLEGPCTDRLIRFTGMP